MNSLTQTKLNYSLGYKLIIKSFNQNATVDNNSLSDYSK